MVLALGVACLGVLGAFSPWIYGRIRCQVLLSRLEAGDDPAARRELVDGRHVEKAHERLLAARSMLLARNLVELAREGLLDGAPRRDAFELCFPAGFTEQPARVDPESRAPGQLVVVRTNGSVSEIVDARPWTKGSYRVEVPGSGGDAQEYLEYFVTGEGSEARLVFERCSRLLFPPNAKTVAERFRRETLDLTGVPDPLHLFPRRPRKTTLADGREAIELRLASLGSWRQFIPKRRLFDRSCSYAVLLDLDGGVADGGQREPFLLGHVAVSAATGTGQWFAEDAVLGKPIETLEQGSYWMTFVVPLAVARLEPLEKFRLLFRSAPAFAGKRGFEAPAADSPPFEREYYLPAWER